MVSSVGKFDSLKEVCLTGYVAVFDGYDTFRISHIFNFLVAYVNMFLCNMQEDTI